MNTSFYILKNKIPLTLSKILSKNSRLIFSQSKTFLTINNHLKNKLNFNEGNSQNKNFNLLKSFSKKNYCEKTGNLIMLNSRNEIKITFEEKTFSIFFNENDSINVVNEKISGINEKIQSVEFIQFESKEILSDEIKNKTLMKEFMSYPFIIRINKHISFTLVPGVFQQLFEESGIAKELQSNNIDNMKTSEDIKNIILLSLYDLKEKNYTNKNNYEEEKALYISSIKSKLEQREKFLKSLFEIQVLSEKMVYDKLIFMSKVAIKLGMLFAVSHFSVFYLLIYKFYAWDVIEPITYIVGNVYWVATLGFLAFKNQKLEFNMLQYDSIRDLYLDKYSKQHNYKPEEKNKLHEELVTIEQLKLGLIDI